MSSDAYGLPESILGRHPDEFYGAVGRIVCLSALLEQKVTTLRHTLEQVTQDLYAKEPISCQIEQARRLAGVLQPGVREDVKAFLDQAEIAFRKRNGVVHSAFPAQPDGRIWGYRPTRKAPTQDKLVPRDKPIPRGDSDTVDFTIESLKEFIAELAELVSRFNQMHNYCSNYRLPKGGDHPMP